MAATLYRKSAELPESALYNHHERQAAEWQKGTCKHYRVPRKLTVYVAVMDSEAPSEYVVL